ncbi:imidazole glycerol phosphate synthase cyclase subunit [Geomonas limicola]|uniref:imidazole glycerol-phosphate synthase n=1 Tax=Geomonas limicola TaxID=2740186 RepID=A0A6V8N7G9_9BACT|nr:imidazole glycerol phosphate synthase cyclase subunit [Geomonas limicola]GFO68505.1 imidazole glycerol phosphate synthase cyclase subunit [Geomonas limicola]
MLKVRIIPTLLWKNLGLVKGVGFDSWRRVGTIMPAVKVYNTRQVDELIVVDISATSEERLPDFAEVREFSAECFVPLTVGGGIRELAEIKELLRAGADKVSINSAAYERPTLIEQAAERFGAQCVVASIDASRNPDGSYRCLSRSGSADTGREPGEWAEELERRGAGEILITSVERDGTMTGYDLELIRLVADRVKIPVIASGGAGNYGHLHEALTVGGAAAVAAASIFHFTEQTPLEAKKFLAAQGIPVRNVRVAP